MHRPINCGLLITCGVMLFVLPIQGQLQRTTPETTFEGPVPTCCLQVSLYYVKEKVTECYEQNQFSIRQCKIHAFILMTDGGLFCVDPTARWLPDKLKQMEEDGVFCKPLVQKP